MNMTQDLITARAALARLDTTDVYGRMSQKLLDDKVGPQPPHPSLGLVANIVRGEPGIVQRVRDEGFDARLAGVPYRKNPYFEDGGRGWWAEGWCAADDNMPEEEYNRG